MFEEAKETFVTHMLQMSCFVVHRSKDVYRKDRIRHMFAEKLPNVSYEFLDAVDGYSELTMAPSHLKNVSLIRARDRLYIHHMGIKNPYHDRRPNAGVLAAAISHRMVYERIVRENIRYAVVFEDDVYYTQNDGGGMFQAALNALPEHLDVGLMFVPLTYRGDICQRNEYWNECFHYSFSGAYAYVITFAGAAKILEALESCIFLAPDDHLSVLTQIGVLKTYVSVHCMFNTHEGPTTLRGPDTRIVGNLPNWQPKIFSLLNEFVCSED